MKKIFALMMSLLLIITTSQASIVTLYGPECTVTMNSPSNRVIMLSDLKGGIRWWKVLSGGVNVVDNKFVMPEADVEVQPMYEGNQIVVEQTSNGTITPGTTETTERSNYTFTITPNSGYKIASLKVDGSSVEITGSYTFENVISNHTITAIFSPASSYTVTYNSNGGTGNMDQQTFTEGIAQNLATNTFTRNGYTFNNWNTTQDGTGTSCADGASYTATGDVTLYAQWTPINYTISYNLDGGTVTGNPTTYTAESNAITLVNPTKDGYTFTGWTGSNGTTPSTTVTIPKGSTGNKTYTANWESTWVGWNAPVLTTGLTPVNWNGSSWATTTESNWDYNYNSVAEATHSTVAGNGDGKWANAQTADGSLYVWIPRYSYKITSGEHSDGNSWNSLDAAGTNKIEVKFSNGTTDDTSNSYIAHPAFTFGTDELQGIWVAKYEASQGTTTNETSVPTSSTSVAKSIPNVDAWDSGSIDVSDMFDYAYNTYRNADSHLMKNIEWGAVAYLTNAIGRIPYINNNSYTKTGNAGESQDVDETSTTTDIWNTANGVRASTTHNVYGIYDMSGGGYEYVSAYINNGNASMISCLESFASSLVNAAEKYKDVYPVGSSNSPANNYAAWSNIKGDALYETSNSYSGSTSWDGDVSNIGEYSPIFMRGGKNNDGSYSGIFNFCTLNGAGASLGGYSNCSFRVVLGIQ